MTVPAAPERHDLVTHRRVLGIALPMMLANLTTPLLGVVGTAVIGRLGEAALLGAVAISALVFDSIFWLFGFLRMGTVALTAQALGAGDRREQRAVLVRALIVAGAVSAVIVVLQWPIARIAYGLIGASDEVTTAAEAYFYVRIWSTPFALGNYALLGWLLGLARAGTALALQITVNLVSTAAVAVAVFGFRLGVAGAAAGALVAEAVGFTLGLAIAWRLGGGLAGLGRAVVLQPAKLVRMLVVNRDIMIRTAALIAAFAFFTAQGAREGDVTLAANAVLYNLVLVGAFFLDGFATAAEQLCGRAVGARDAAAFARAVGLALGWGFGFGAATTLGFLVGGEALIAFMSTSPEVRAAAADYLVFAALAPLAGVAAYGYDGIYIGATWTRDMRNLMVVALLIYLAAWWALDGLGNAGLWGSLLVFLAARGVLQAARYPALVKGTFGP